jgi:hypothetical protein
MAKKSGTRIPYNNPHIKRKLEKQMKKMNRLTIVLTVVALLIGLGAGALAARIMTKNDSFALLGEKTYTYTVGEGNGSVRFADPGWHATAFGQDVGDKVVTTTNLTEDGDGYLVDTSKEGTYYISYSVSSIRYKEVLLVRAIEVKAASGEEGGEG